MCKCHTPKLIQLGVIYLVLNVPLRLMETLIWCIKAEAIKVGKEVEVVIQNQSCHILVYFAILRKRVGKSTYTAHAATIYLLGGTSPIGNTS